MNTSHNSCLVFEFTLNKNVGKIQCAIAYDTVALPTELHRLVQFKSILSERFSSLVFHIYSRLFTAFHGFSRFTYGKPTGDVGGLEIGFSASP